MITRSHLRYVKPDTDTLFYHLFLFFEVEKNPRDTHPPATYPAMFLSNYTKFSGLIKHNKSRVRISIFNEQPLWRGGGGVGI